MKYVIISGILINFSIASNNSTNIIEPNKINNTTNKKKEKIYIEYAIAKKNEISIVLYGVKKSLINKIIDISLNIIGSITFIPLMIYFLTNESSSKISNDNNIFSIFFNNFFLVIYSIKKDIFTINNSKILAIILLLTNIILMLLPYLSTKLINIKKNKNYNIYYQKLNINESNLFLIVTYINVILLYLIFIFFPIIWLNFISMNRNRNSILLSFFMLVL